MIVGVELLVQVVKALDDGLDGARVDFSLRDRNVDLVGLPEIAEIGAAPEPAVLFRHAVTGQRLARLGVEPGVERPQARGRNVRAARDPGLHEVVPDVGHHQPDRGEHTGPLRHQDRGNADLLGQRRGVHGAGAAEGDQGQIARIEALLGRADPHGAFHVGVGDADDPRRRRLGRQPERRADPLHERPPRGIEIHPHLAAQEAIRMEPAEHQVGVGHGRLVAAAPIGGRPGFGARALRSDVQTVELVQPGDAAGPGANGVDLDHGQHHGMLRDAAFGGHAQLAPVDQRDIRAGAAHVDAQQVAPLPRPADPLDGECTTRRTRGNQANRIVLGGVDRERAAVGLHEQNLRVGQDRPDARPQLLQVARNQGHGGGVQRHGAHALELPDLTANLLGSRDMDARQSLAQPILYQHLIRRIDVGVEETDGDGLSAAVTDRVEQPLHRLVVGLFQDLAIGRRALGGAEAALARDYRQRLVLQQVVHVGPEVAADLQHVAKSLGGQERRLGQLVLDHRVRDQGRTVNQERDARGIDLRQLESALHGVDKGAGRIAAPARNLGDGDAAAILLHHGNVREGAADIHAQSDRAHFSPAAFPLAPLCVRSASSTAPSPPLPRLGRAGRAAWLNGTSYLNLQRSIR